MATPTTVQQGISRVILYGGVFLSLDIFLSWCFYGSLVVQILQYARALQTTLRKERVWQVWSVAAVFFLSSVQTAVNVSRTINIFVRHYGERDYIDTYRRRPAGPFLSFLGLLIVAIVQVLVRDRTVSLRRSIWLGPPNWIQKGCTIVARILLVTTVITGIVGYALVLQYPKYTDIIREVVKPKMPVFLIFQILFNTGCLALCLLKQLTMWYDIGEARRCTTTSHPNAQRTWDVLRDLWRVSLQNSMIVMITHCLMLLSLCTEGSAAISGRPCVTLSAVYAHSLLAHILSPQLTRRRHILEDGGLDALPLHQVHQGEKRKNLFGLGRFKRRSKVRASGAGRLNQACSSSSSLASNGGNRAGSAIGFLTIIRGDEANGKLARRRDSALSESRVRRTITVVSYVIREEDFAVETPPSGAESQAPSRTAKLVGAVDDLGGQTAAAEEDWTTIRNRIGYGHACWVTTASAQRPLTAQTHFLSPPSPTGSPQPSCDGMSTRTRTPTPEPSVTTKRDGDRFLLRPAGPSFLHRKSATSVSGLSRRPALTHIRRRSSAADFSGSETRVKIAPTRSAPPAHDELAFVESFPSGAVRSTMYGTYDPDLVNSLALPAFVTLRPPINDQPPAIT